MQNKHRRKFQVDSLRTRELVLCEDLDRVGVLVRALQEENAALAERHREAVEAAEAARSDLSEETRAAARASADNQALAHKAKLIENRMSRMQDELEEARTAVKGAEDAHERAREGARQVTFP
jgi:hypothetical protein